MKGRARAGSIAVLALIVLPGVVFGGGCGGDSERDRVEDYLHDASDVQRRSAPAFRRANEVYRRFASGDLKPNRAPAELAQAERSIGVARQRLGKLDPPSETAELHRRLLRVYDLNASLARDTTRLGRYLPAAAAALRPLRTINRRLRAGLGASQDTANQGRALGRYADALGKVVARLKRLRPPPVLEAADRARLRRLAATRLLASRLRDALERRDSKTVALLLLRFRRVTGSGAGQRAFTAGSLRAYNRRYLAIARAAGAVQAERRRIERSL